MNVLSLFSGIGGLELGLERAGMTVVGQVEIDPFCRRVLAKHWPDVPRHDDVRTAAEWWLSEERPTVDLICGGFPCQPVSFAGRRQAQADERWLWPAFADTIRQVRPRYALLENVPGLTSAGMGDVLGDLATLGYDAEWQCVPAAALGAPHLRWRWFCIAYANGSPFESRRWRRESSSGSKSPGTDADSCGRWSGPRFVGGVGAAELGERKGSPTSAEDVADADEERCRWWPRDERQGGRGKPTDCGWWSAEPDVGRVAHGIPGRVDRLRALGNAVVPQVSEYVGRLIMARGLERVA